MMKAGTSQYVQLHQWVSKQLGTPKLCVNCGSTSAKKFEWANISGEYQKDESDWKRLCTPCHRMFDGKTGVCKKGHKITEENAYYDKNPAKGRACGICKKINNHINYLKRKEEQ